MLLKDALSHLAILGATSIVLRNGHTVELAELDMLIGPSSRTRRFVLSPRDRWVDVLDELTGRLLGRALTLWALPFDHLLAAER